MSQISSQNKFKLDYDYENGSEDNDSQQMLNGS